MKISTLLSVVFFDIDTEFYKGLLKTIVTECGGASLEPQLLNSAKCQSIKNSKPSWGKSTRPYLKAKKLGA
jgi:hypothetical protein